MYHSLFSPQILIEWLEVVFMTAVDAGRLEARGPRLLRFRHGGGRAV